MKTLILFLLMAVTIPFYSQTNTPTPEQDLMGFLPKFNYEALNYYSEEPGKTRVDVYVEVPFLGIQFLKSDNGFTANYSITISFFDESKEKLLTEKNWSETVNSKTFESTTSKSNYYLSVKSFNLEPRIYFLRCEVVDKDSKKSYVREELFTVRTITPPVGVSDLLLVSKTRVVNGQEQVIPNISRNVAAQKDGITLYYELYADTSREAALEYSILNTKKENITTQSEKLMLNPGRNSIKYTFKNAQIDMGIYELNVLVKGDDGNVLSKTNKRFFSRWAGMPSSVNDLDKAVEQIVYIAKPSEMNHIEDAETREEKTKRFVEFWQQKDPTPGTEQNEVFEEYFRRIAYANEHFKHYQEGWRTDMGMVFVTLGPPNNVERHPFEFDTKPYEVWDYYDINKRFVFVDETGFGDYRLVSQPYGNWWKYRQ